MKDQGSLLYPAGNTFSHTCSTLVSDFEIISPAPGLTYYHVPNSAHEPSCVSASLTKVGVSVTPCTKPYESGNYYDLLSWRAANKNEKLTLSPPPYDGGRLNQLNTENDFLLTLIVQKYMDEDLIDDCIAYLVNEDEDLARMFLAQLYIDGGSFDDAQTALDNINVTDNEDLAAFVELYNVILSLAKDGLGYADMTDAQWSTIQGIADGSTVYGECARNILNQMETEESPMAASLNHVVNGRMLQAFPNPARGVLYITGITQGIAFTISDLSGRIVNQGLWANPREGIDIRALTNGVYLIKITDGKGMPTLLKFVKAE
jgi:hypothetical protein